MVRTSDRATKRLEHDSTLVVRDDICIAIFRLVHVAIRMLPGKMLLGVDALEFLQASGGLYARGLMNDNFWLSVASARLWLFALPAAAGRSLGVALKTAKSGNFCSIRKRRKQRKAARREQTRFAAASLRSEISLRAHFRRQCGCQFLWRSQTQVGSQKEMLRFFCVLHR